MKYFFIFFTLMCLIFVTGNVARTGDEPVPSKGKDEIKAVSASTKAARVYPIAPGVWYPQDGALPEKPIRYYRVRCFPGCHRGSPHGKYPNEPLNMKPIFPTSTVPAQPAAKGNTK